MFDNTKIIDLTCKNIREISKKERIMGLNLKSWYIVSLMPVSLQMHIGFLNTIFLFLFMTAFFYIAEFFDEDITDIFFARIVIKSPVRQFWS